MPTPSKFPTDWILPPLEDVLYLTGPTASGKTQIAVELADALAKKSSLVEIISVDSMAIYRQTQPPNPSASHPSPDRYR
jgi:tRNA dimethylallyltransferase